MGYIRFFRRVQIVPGVRLNLSKSGPSLSLGVRGAHLTLGRHGVRKTAGLPGTGVFYTSHQGWHSGLHSAPEFSVPAPPNEGNWLAVIVIVVVLIALTLLGQTFGR
ncbi:MAG: DUF4236 domain-containing protein [Terriglobales bacterium]